MKRCGRSTRLPTDCYDHHENNGSEGHQKRAEDAFVYQAVEPENRPAQNRGDFLDRVFNGSAEPLLAHLVQERRRTKDFDGLRMIREKK